jgi:hypothetical protein
MDHNNSSKTLEDNDGTIDVLVIEKLEGWRINNSIGKKIDVSRVSIATLALGSRPRQRAYKVTSQEGSPGIMTHAPRSVRECEGMDPHIPKGTPTLGVGVLADSCVTTPLLEECEDDTHTPEMGTWESSETLKTSELDCRGQNTSP